MYDLPRPGLSLLRRGRSSISGRCRLPRRWLSSLGRLGCGLAHAQDERPDLITPAFFKNKAEAVDNHVTAFVPPPHIIQVTIDNRAGRLQILRNHPDLGKSD